MRLFESIEPVNIINIEPVTYNSFLYTCKEFYELNFEELEFISSKEELYIFEELKTVSNEYINELYEYIQYINYKII